MKVGLIGLGIMGKPMAKNMLKAGYDLTVNDLNEAAVEEVVAAGAKHAAPQVIQGFIRAGLLYEDARHHNCVFVGRDSTGKPVFANQRGTYDRNGPGFKGDVTGSNKDIAFCLPCDPSQDWVAVFEAPIDLMSFCTLHRQVRSNAIALCGLYQGPLDNYLRQNPHLKRIVLSIKTPARGKDWNEYLLWWGCEERRQENRER